MDQQSNYYAKHNIASLNYQSPYVPTANDYSTAAYNESTPQSLYHSALSSNSTNETASGVSSISNSSGHCNTDSSANAANYARTSSTYNHPNATDYSNATYARYYQQFITDQALAASNVSTAASSTADCSSLSYGSAAAYTTKSYDTTTHSSHVPVIAAAAATASSATGHSSQSGNYHANTINYGSSYQNVDYSAQKALNAGYGNSAAMLSAQNRTAINATGSYASNAIDQSMQSTAKTARTAAPADPAKLSAKTSVIKSNTANGPLNYSKYSAYGAYSNQKPATGHEKVAASSGRDAYNVPSNHKSGEVYCPEAISARYANANYALNVSGSATAHTNLTYLSSNNFHLGYGHHLGQPQSTVHHGRTSNMLPASGYQAALEESMSANYFNRQSNLLVRPTPNTYKQCQLDYANAYGYGRNVNGSSGTGAASASPASMSKSQTQKLMINDPATGYSTLDTSVDRRYLKQYGAMYGQNYLNASNNYVDYSQYPGFTATNTNAYFPPTTHSQKILYNYNNGLNAYATNMNGSHLPLATNQSGLPAMASSTTAIPTTTVTTTASVVQQPVPINPNASQLISSNYDSSLHALLQPYNNQYQQTAYPPILYKTLQSSNYLSSMKAGVAPTAANADKLYADQVRERYCSSLDFEDQINSSRILKQARANQAQSHAARAMPSTTTTTTTTTSTAATMATGTGGDASASRSNYDLQVKAASDANANRLRGSAIVNNYDYYNADLYQYQAGGRKMVADQHHVNWHKAKLAVAPTASGASAMPTVYMHPKKQNLREFLSTWNEFEDEADVSEGSRNKTAKSNAYHGTAAAATSAAAASAAPATPAVAKVATFEKRDKPSENTVVVQPIPYPSQHHQMQAPLIPPPTYHHHHHHHHVQPPVAAVPPTTVPPSTPTSKINIGITVDNNGGQNLPDIVIDIEKKPNGDGEPFERANVIQSIPKLNPKEKLYILDSIDVPLSDLSKYRHVDVFNENELPSNIVLPPPPPLRHEEDSIPEPRKGGSDSETRCSDADFGRCTYNAAEDDTNAVECKNTITMRKIIKKYLKQDRRRKRPESGAAQAAGVRASNETSSNLSTPLKSLSPAHEFESDGIFGSSYPVDLSTHSKEGVDEFITNWSICSGDSDSDFDLMGSPLAEIMQLTASPELHPLQENVTGQAVVDRLGLDAAKRVEALVENEKAADRQNASSGQAKERLSPMKSDGEIGHGVDEKHKETAKAKQAESINSDNDVILIDIDDDDDVVEEPRRVERPTQEETVKTDVSATEEVSENGGEMEVRAIDEAPLEHPIMEPLDHPLMKPLEHPIMVPPEDPIMEVVEKQPQTHSYPILSNALSVIQEPINEKPSIGLQNAEPVDKAMDADEPAEKSPVDVRGNDTDPPNKIDAEHSSETMSLVVPVIDIESDEDMPASSSLSAADNSAEHLANAASRGDDDNGIVDLTAERAIERDASTEAPSAAGVDSLQTICLHEINSKEFRDYFVLHRRPEDSECCAPTEPNEQPTSLPLSAHEDSSDVVASTVESMPDPVPSRVPSLRSLAREAVLLNQSRMTSNLKSAQIAYNYESDAKMPDVSMDSNTNRVKTLRELAHEVANTIYSFNVKPLQDICKIAIEKYSHLYQMHYVDVEQSQHSSYVQDGVIDDQPMEIGM